MEGKKKRLTLARTVHGVSIALVAASGFARSWPITLSVAAGCLIGLANFHLISGLVGGLLGNPDGKKRKIALFLIFKLVVIFPIIGLILLKTDVRAWALLAGLSNIFLAVLLFAVKDLKHA